MIEQFQSLMKALEAGGQNAAPSTLTQGSALQTEDLSPIMHNASFEDADIILQKSVNTKQVKSMMYQCNRQLDYGQMGASAQWEGGAGEETTANIVREVYPISFYSTTKRTTVAANHIAAFDGVKAEDRVAKDAALLLAADIEFDFFRGRSEFSNAGVFDGNPLLLAEMPSMIGIDSQVRRSDNQANQLDQMLSEFGADGSVIISANGTLTQSLLEDSTVRSRMNNGRAKKFLLDPISLSAYNKIAHAKERIQLAGSPQGATGAELKTQWTSNGPAVLEPSRFLSGKTRPAAPRLGAPTAPAVPSLADTGAGSTLLSTGTYLYYVTAVNERGESARSTTATQAVTAGDKVTVTITNQATVRYFNVYRSGVGGTAAQAKFIGRIKQTGSANPVFTDLGNRSPGSVTGYLIQEDTLEQGVLAPFSELKMGINSLSTISAFYKFMSVGAILPRKNVLMDNLDGQLS